MNFSFELLLVLGVIGFYLADSVILLFHNELVLQGTKKHWRYSYRNAGFEVAGKYVVLPNPFLPFKALFKVRWQISIDPDMAKATKTLEQISSMTQAMLPLQLLAILLWIQLIILTPVVVWFYGLGLLFLFLLVWVYCTIIIALIIVFIKRQHFVLSKHAFLKLAFDVLVCVPFSINLLRKLTFRMSMPGDALLIAERLLPSALFMQLINEVLSEIDMMMTVTDDNHAEKYRQLECYKLFLEQKLK